MVLYAFYRLRAPKWTEIELKTAKLRVGAPFLRCSGAIFMPLHSWGHARKIGKSRSGEVLADTQMGHELNDEKCTVCSFGSPAAEIILDAEPDTVSGTENSANDKLNQSGNNDENEKI